jgi:hypothetical protein
MLETLSTYLPLFETWAKLFPTTDYTQLAKCIKSTCSDFVAFLVEAILYFQRASFCIYASNPLECNNAYKCNLVNTLRIIASTGLEGEFSKCEEKIKRRTRQLDLHVTTVGLQSSQRRDQDIMKFLQASTLNHNAPPAVTLPFRFLQNCIRDDQFFSRCKCVEELDSHLSRRERTMQSVVIHGLGGCGKSSVAKEYMYLRFMDYNVVLWLYADASSKLDTQCIQLARALGIKTDEGHAHEAILHWINHLCLFDLHLLVQVFGANNS